MTVKDKMKRAFTLIELLVVIAIIAILSALLFPALSRAKEMGRRVRCLSNLRQMMLGSFQYSDESGDGWMLPLPIRPPIATPSILRPGQRLWHPSDLMFELKHWPSMGDFNGWTRTQEDGIMMCPSVQKMHPRKFEPGPGAMVCHGTTYFRTYAFTRLNYNHNDVAALNRDGTYGPYKLHEIRQPAKTSLFFDSPLEPVGSYMRCHKEYDGNKFPGNLPPGGSGMDQYLIVSMTHGFQGFNRVCWDGHGEWFKLQGCRPGVNLATSPQFRLDFNATCTKD
jgi:prepilin-type N-terminal cleavage/methylation domain-containing protein